MGFFDTVSDLLGESGGGETRGEEAEGERIALLESIDVANSEVEAEVDVDDPDELQNFLEAEERQLREQVDRLVEMGVDTVLCRGEIDELARGFLDEEGVTAIDMVVEDDLRTVEKASGGRIRPGPDDLAADDLGGGSVERGGSEGTFRVEAARTADDISIETRSEDDGSDAPDEESDADADG